MIRDNMIRDNPDYFQWVSRKVPQTPEQCAFWFRRIQRPLSRSQMTPTLAHSKKIPSSGACWSPWVPVICRAADR